MKRIIITSICSALMFVATLFAPSINSESSIDGEEYKLRHDLSIWEVKGPQERDNSSFKKNIDFFNEYKETFKSEENYESGDEALYRFRYFQDENIINRFQKFYCTFYRNETERQAVTKNYMNKLRGVEEQSVETVYPEGRSVVLESTQEEKDEYTKIAQKYLSLYESGEWNGEGTLEEGVNVSLFLGEVKVNGYLTGVKTSQRLLCDKLEAMYISGEWDGKLTVIDEHTAEIDEEFGCLLIDYEETCIGKRPLDMTEDYFFHYFDSFTYVKGIGVYIIEDNQLKRLERQRLITLPGEKIEFDEGLYLLYYDNEEGVLYIYLFKDGENITYRVPDLNKSEIEFVDDVELQN